MSVGGAPAHFFKYTVAGRETQHAGNAQIEVEH